MGKKLPYILLILVMLFWGANFHFVKIALQDFSPMAVATLRFFFGVISLVLLLYFQLGKKFLGFRCSKRELWYIFLTSFFGIFLTIYFFNIGLKTTSAINGSLIIATSPAITAVFIFVFQRIKLNIIQWFSIALSFFGVLLILIKGDFSKLAALQFEIGDIYILCMALVFSLSQIIVNKYIPHIQATMLTAISSLMALVMFAFFSVPELIINPMPITLSFWTSILFMGIIGTGFAYSAFYYCVIELGASISTLYMNLIPFFAVLLAYPFGEQIYLVQIVGGVIIVTGLILFGIAKKKRMKRLMEFSNLL